MRFIKDLHFTKERYFTGFSLKRILKMEIVVFRQNDVYPIEGILYLEVNFKSLKKK